MARKDKPPHHSSIRTRMNLLVIGVVTMSILPAAGLVAGDAIERQAQSRWTMATGAAELLAGNATGPAQTQNTSQANALMRAATQIPGVAYARLDLPNGQMLAEAGSGSRLPTDILLDTTTTHAPAAGLAFHRVVRVIAPVRQGPNTFGEITIVHTSGDFIPDLLRALAGILVLGGCVMAAGLYLARRMQNAVTCPLGDLTRSVEAVTRDGDLSLRVVTASHDEIGALATSYNLMLDSLARRKAPVDLQDADIAIPDMAANPVIEADVTEANFAEPSVELPVPSNDDVEVAPAAEAPVTIAALSDIDILDFVDDGLARFRARAHDKGLELTTTADPAAPRRMTGDLATLDTVLAALLSNAIKFTDTGHICVEIACDPKAGLMRLIVHDTGAGIARPQLKSILKASEFETAASPGDFIRLPAARELVEAMGGALAVASDTTGSQFHLRLPVTPDAPTAAPPRADGRTVAIHLAATAERDALAARFEAAGIALAEGGRDADLVLADRTARDRLNVPADRLVLLVEAGDGGGLWVAEGRAWAALPRPLRYNDIDALIEVLARDNGASIADTPDAAPVIEPEAVDIGKALPAPTSLELYAKQGPEALAQIVAAFQTRDSEALADAARTLKWLSLEIGARSVADAADHIEQAVRVEARAVTIDEVALTHARLERALSMLDDAGQPDTADFLETSRALAS